MKRRLENEAIPDGYKVRARNHVLLSDKSISDVVEALIGVHLANAGQAGAADFLTFLGLGFGPDDNIKDVANHKSMKEKLPRSLKANMSFCDLCPVL